MIEILTPGALATVQDLGRRGALGWGVGVSGAMDGMALAAGNILLGNEEGAAAVEIPVFPFRLRFEVAAGFAVTGAHVALSLNERRLLPWWTARAGAGDVLEIGPPEAASWRASRAYLCVAGGLGVAAVLGSRSTQLRGAFGGHDGRPLRQGDRLPLGTPPAGAVHADCGLVPPALALPLEADGIPAIRALPAAEHDRFTEAAVEAFWNEPWKVTPQSDRYGFRLAGPTLAPRAPMELRSHGIVPGVVQVPHGGQPIVQMRDAQPSGGYPKIATVIEADLWRLGQAPIGSRIRFLRTNWEAAVEALDQTRDWLAEARRLVELRRMQERAA
ncbi:biotin-dependent carboxyltransferase family protein [Falsiroseomonas sp. CW058]|uniref:5-oxoprolinase subunit C family protein n=1 Tax=Falsiroseomonas sp. CW058 TaxID=3388664 RepID=UPI003D319856